MVNRATWITGANFAVDNFLGTQVAFVFKILGFWGLHKLLKNLKAE